MANHKLTSTVYPNLRASDDETRINPMVSKRDCRTIVAVTGTTTILAHICQLAIKTTAEYVRANNLTFTDSEKLHDFIRQRPVGTSNATETVAQDDDRRDTGGGEQVADVANVPTEPREKSPARSRTGKSKRK